jgi:hypothetical protein
MTGALLVCSLSVKIAAAEGEPVKKIDPLLEEDRVHKLSIFSYMQPLQKGGRAVPVLITLNIKGPEGLGTFCEYRPMIFEAALQIITDDHVATSERQTLIRDLEEQILESVNYSLPGTPVSRVNVRAGRSASEFGQDIIQTNLICRKLDGMVR